MAFELYQLHLLMNNPEGTLAVGPLPNEVASHFGCRIGIAQLSHRSLHHILDDHSDIDLLTLLCMPEMIRKGLWIADRPNGACVVYQPPDQWELFYASGLKVVGDGFEPYMGSFYRIGKRQIAAKRKRGVVLREHAPV